MKDRRVSTDMEKNTFQKARLPGESRETVVVEFPCQFDAAFEKFLASVGQFKIVAVNLKMDEPPYGGQRKSKSSKAARRRKARRRLMQHVGDTWCGAQVMGAERYDVGDSGEGDAGEGDDVDGDEGSSEDEMNEEENTDVCEEMRLRTYEMGRVALISLSTLYGYTLLIRTCMFWQFPQAFIEFLQGKEYLKVGFGIQADKNRMYTMHGFFILNYVDPRRLLYAWEEFVEDYHFHRFGVYSVASHLFQQQMHNVDAAACLTSLWCAPELSPYLQRAAARETQLTIDVYAEVCIQLSGKWSPRYELSPNAFSDLPFYEELLKAASCHINNGFDMKDFGVKVFAMPAMRKRFMGKSGRMNGGSASNVFVPDTFADRIRLRRSKSSLDSRWKSSLLYASFDVSLFENARCGMGESSQVATLTKKFENVCWEMKIDITRKGRDRHGEPSFSRVTSLVPAVGYYKRKVSSERDHGRGWPPVNANAVQYGWPEVESNLNNNNNAETQCVEPPPPEPRFIEPTPPPEPPRMPNPAVMFSEPAFVFNPEFQSVENIEKQNGCDDGFMGPCFSPVRSPTMEKRNMLSPTPPPLPVKGRGRLVQDELCSATYSQNGVETVIAEGMVLKAGGRGYGMVKPNAVMLGTGQGRGRGRGLCLLNAMEEIVSNVGVPSSIPDLMNKPGKGRGLGGAGGAVFTSDAAWP